MQFAAKSARILFVADADIAQSVERILGKDEVPGPNPGISSIKSPSDIDAEGDFFVLLLGFYEALPCS